MSPQDRLTLWLVRHPRPLIAPGVCYGRLDVPADAEHIRTSAGEMAQAWSASGGPSTHDIVWCSTATRARQLAHALEAAGFPAARPEPRLQEMDFGSWEGTSWQVIPRDAIDAWTESFHHHRPGGGECVHDVLVRVRDALDDCWYQARQRGASRAMWITHAGVIRAVEVLVAHLPWPLNASEWPVSVCPFGAWTIHHWVPGMPRRMK